NPLDAGFPGGRPRRHRCRLPLRTKGCYPASWAGVLPPSSEPAAYDRRTEPTPAAAIEPGVAAPLRVVVADDWYLVREGARSALASIPGIDVVGVAADAVELMDVLAAAQPDSVLLDIRMPPTHRTEGIDAAHEIRRRWPRMGVVILSQFDDPE